VARSRSLARLAELVSNHRIPDSARGAMIRGHDRGSAELTFRLGKQAAAVGRPHFSPPPSSLGDLEITFRAETEEALLRAVYETAPDTTVAEAYAKVPPWYRPPEAAPPGGGAGGGRGGPAKLEDESLSDQESL
jgi:predicted RNA binding protein with dsRBD fold (UPF0201 family)